MKTTSVLKTFMNCLLAVLLMTGSAVSSGCGKQAAVPDSEPETEQAPVSIAGDYYAISCRDEQGTVLPLDGEILHINDDGTGDFEISGEHYSLEWTLNNNVFSFVDAEGDEFSGNYSSGMISGTYFNNYSYLFTSDEELYQSFQFDEESEPSSDRPVTASPSVQTGNAPSVYYTMQALYEPQYGIKTANALVPYGWKASVSVLWGLCSTMYPAVATIRLTSPDSDAVIEIQSTMAYLQMARNGSWVPEGTYLDLYNIYLNYRNAHAYNEYILGLLGYKGTVLKEQGPGYDMQLDLNGEANAYLAALSSVSGTRGVQCEGSFEKTSYFITQGDAYEVEVSSSVIMAETVNGMYDTYQWTVPYTAVFTAYTEKAYSDYAPVFDNVVINSNFTNEFRFVVQQNAAYLNDMIHNYLMEKVYSPSSGDITGWDSQYVETEQDKLVNAWCDVITERDEYTTADGNAIKVPTSYDTVYQDGDLIYMGPDASAPQGWTQLHKK